MSFNYAPLRQGIKLPPSGWVLAGMLALYVLAGMFGRDPWRGEDAIHIGAAWHVFHYNDWLSPDLAGRAFDEPPLYYWSSALFAKLFGSFLPLHEALRLASAFWIALALGGLYYASRALYGQKNAAASAMLLAGTSGLIIHAHDAQPMLVAVAAYATSLGAFAILERKPLLASCIYGLSLAVCFLGTGIATTLPLLLISPLIWAQSQERTKTAQHLLLALAFASLLALPWPVLLFSIEPARFHSWLSAEIDPVRQTLLHPSLIGFIAPLPWFAFPTLPLAGWTLWLKRHQLKAPAQALPISLFLITLLILSISSPAREIPTLLLLPSIALLATQGALSLRRGAANAFDWFGMMTFTLIIALVWLAWSALVLGWPTRLAQRATALQPGFVAHFNVFAVSTAAIISLGWIWLIFTAPRSPYRSLTHWTMGFTTLWLCLTTLLLPWFDYGKSYRPVAEAVARIVPDKASCLAERALTRTQRASFSYFVGIEPSAFDSLAGKKCDWLLIAGDFRKEAPPAGGSWEKIWEGTRPGDRREKFRLYHRKMEQAGPLEK